MNTPFALPSRLRPAFVLGVAAAAIAALGLTACGGSGSSQEDMTRARHQVAYHVHKEERLRKLERELANVRSRRDVHVEISTAGTTPTAQPSTYSYSIADSPSVPSGSSCGGELSVNSYTSCPFAENVERAYFEEIGSGSGNVEAYSPVTGRSYVMYCTASPHECTGGDDAALYFP
jgi:hypothetical protein